jgi:5-methylcytosine-specific restriction enzyme A
MSRQFRTTESYKAEHKTRGMIGAFLRSRGFAVESDQSNSHGQTIMATTPEGIRLTMRVNLCWRREISKIKSNRIKSYSAAQLMARVKDGNWEGSISDKVERYKSKGITHLLIVQREGEKIVYAALIPISELLTIWCAQRDISKRLIKKGKLGRRRKNHAMNGSSPTLWLQDDRAKEVPAALWNHAGVLDLVRTDKIVSVDNQKIIIDDTFDDIPVLDYSLIGSDGAPTTPIIRSCVKRDPRVRAAVLQRAKRKCENASCGIAKDYSGFLDVHHILGTRKSDRVWNCVALCPNCHREAHAAPGRGNINKILLKIAERSKSG